MSGVNQHSGTKSNRIASGGIVSGVVRPERASTSLFKSKIRRQLTWNTAERNNNRAEDSMAMIGSGL